MSDLLISRRFILPFMEQQRRVSMHTRNEKCKSLISQHVFCAGTELMAGICPKRKPRKLHFKRFGIQRTIKSGRRGGRRLFYSWRRYLILVCISFRLMFPNINSLATADAVLENFALAPPQNHKRNQLLMFIHFGGSARHSRHRLFASECL